MMVLTPTGMVNATEIPKLFKKKKKWKKKTTNSPFLKMLLLDFDMYSDHLSSIQPGNTHPDL